MTDAGIGRCTADRADAIGRDVFAGRMIVGATLCIFNRRCLRNASENAADWQAPATHVSESNRA